MVLVVTLGQQCSIMSGHVFLWHGSSSNDHHKDPRDAFVQATGDFDGNLCISLFCCRGSCCGSGWCNKA